MCGLVGYASSEKGRNKDQRQDILMEMLAIDSFRGWDSTGVAAVPYGKEQQDPIVYKRALNGYDFIQTRTARQIISNTHDYGVVIGHNRAATRGTVNDECAHPFQFGHITLVHNGTIRNCYDFVNHNDCPIDVDSAKVAFAMERDGEKETLEKLDGGYALVWWNSKDQTLNVARNEQKPFYWVYEEKANTMYWASEDSLLYHVLLRRNVGIDGMVLFPEKNHWYKFNLTDLRRYTKTPFTSSQGRQKVLGVPFATGTKMPPTAEDLAEWTALHDGAMTEDLTGDETISTEVEGSEIDEIRRSLSHQRLKDFKRAGVPTSKKKIEKATRELHKLGIMYNAPRIMIPQTWVKYQNQVNLGIVLGTLTKGDHMAQLHQVTKVQYEEYLEYKKIFVRCVNTRAIGRNHTGIVVIEHATQQAHYAKWVKNKALEASLSDDDKEGKSPLELAREYYGPGLSLITLAKFRELAVGGCGECGGWINPGFHDRTAWIGTPASPICHICTSDVAVCAKLGISPDKDLAVAKPINIH